MDVTDEPTPLIQELQGLLDRLTAPDLTLDEASRLRPHLMHVLATLGGVQEARTSRAGPTRRIPSTSDIRSRRSPDGAM